MDSLARHEPSEGSGGEDEASLSLKEAFVEPKLLFMLIETDQQLTGEVKAGFLAGRKFLAGIVTQVPAAISAAGSSRVFVPRLRDGLASHRINGDAAEKTEATVSVEDTCERIAK